VVPNSLNPKHNNTSVIDGAGVKNILDTDKRVLVGCKFPRVRLQYDKIQGVRILVGCKIPGVKLGYDNIQQVKMKNAAVKLIVLDSNIDYNNVGESTGVDMHAHEVVSYEMVLPMDQNGSFLIIGKVADLGQHRVDQVEGSTNLTAGDVHN